MAKVVSTISQTFKKISAGVQTGAKRALNDSLGVTKTSVIKDLQAETGLAAKLVRPRVGMIKASDKIMQGKISIGTKVGINLSEFAPKEKKVILSGVSSGKKGRPKSRTYYGVTVKIGKQSRFLVPGGFLRTVKNGKELVLARKGEARYPTVALKTKLIEESATAVMDKAKTKLRAEFEARIDKALAKELDKI